MLKYLHFIVPLCSILMTQTVLADNLYDNKYIRSREALMSRQIPIEWVEEIDEELCELETNLTENSLSFLDASGKIPAGILFGNVHHFGHYEQCLRIDETVEGVNIRGKYCMLGLNLNEIDLPDGLPPIPPSISIASLFAVCVRDACPATLDHILPGVIESPHVMFCRRVHDKPIASQDIAAIVVFSILGLLLLAGTGYQLWNKILYEKDVPKIAKTFSVYHHIDKLTTYPTNVNPLSCINGIRTISTLWVILGHTYSSLGHGTISNSLAVFEFLNTFGATFIFATGLAVDTFFYLAAFLLTWSLLKKFNNKVAYAKSVPFIALNRYLRLTPLLAAVMLLQMSFFNHITDGPDWSVVDWLVGNCVDSWWVNMLYLQNYLRTTSSMCMSESWYLAFDMQLNLAAPIVIIFLFSGMKYAIFALTVACMAALGGHLGYQYAFDAAPEIQVIGDSDTDPIGQLLFRNTTRCTAQFLLGIVVAYVLFQMKKRNISITSKLYMAAHWVITAALLILPFYGLYAMRQPGVNENTANFFSAWHQPTWVLGVGGVIVACMHGFGGPVQWFLGHKMWTIPARLSYAMYLLHRQIIVVVVASYVTPFAFSNAYILDRYLNNVCLTVIASFILYVCVEGPFADLCNMLMAKITGSRKENENKLENKKEDGSLPSIEAAKEKQDQ